MVVGLNSRDNDMPVNIVKEKSRLTSRSSTADIAVKLEPPFILLDQYLELVAEDELLGADAEESPPAQAVPHLQRARARRASPSQKLPPEGNPRR